MARGLARFFLAVPILLALIAFAAVACGPYYPEAVFVQREHPDMPFDAYAAGKLGIVQPSYNYSFLVVAYRYFSGRSFSDAEQKQLTAFWNDRMFLSEEFHYDNRPPQTTEQRAEDARDLWGNAHQQYGGTDTQAALSTAQAPPAGSGLVVYAAGPNYENFVDCLPDAFLTATKTLQQRAQQFGPASAPVAAWLDAQDAVFENCGADAANPEIPPPADGSLPEIIRKDREYQTAAAYFYAGHLDEAKRRFLVIAADASSPWRATAALVAARCDIRAFALADNDPQAATRVANADAQLSKIIGDPAFRSVRTAAEQLRGITQLRIDPEARADELARTLERDSSPETFENDFGDYTQSLENGDAFTAKPKGQLAAMSDWISAFRNSSAPNTEDFRVSRWQQTQSVPWLVAALTYALPDTPQLPLLLDAASKIPATSPAYLTVAFHRNRLLEAQARDAQARGDVDAILRAPAGQMPASARNLFLALRMKLAQNLGEFVRFAPREPSAVYFNFQGKASGPEFDADAGAILSQRIPSQLLATTAADAAFPAALRREVAQAAWLRAVLLKQDALTTQVIPALSSVAPNLAEGLKSYSNAAPGAARAFAAAFLVLQQPEMHPYVVAGAGRIAPPGELDNYRQNWWCGAMRADSDYGTDAMRPIARFDLALRMLYPDGKPTDPPFLTPAQREAAALEWTTLSGLPSAPDWLGQQVLAWAKSHPADPRVPEALHRVVVSTRIGCKDGDTRSYSKQAFTLLHQNYPQSEWTSQTPYWYN